MAWSDNMTTEDFERNHRQWREQQRKDAAGLRMLAAMYLREAERIERMMGRTTTSEES